MLSGTGYRKDSRHHRIVLVYLQQNKSKVLGTTNKPPRERQDIERTYVKDPPHTPKDKGWQVINASQSKNIYKLYDNNMK